MDRLQTYNDGDPFLNIRLQLGKRAFQKNSKAKIVFVGVGSIGSNLAVALAGTGFKNFILVDGDTVGRRNIPLCAPFKKTDVGRHKVQVLAEFLKSKFEDMKIDLYPQYTDKIDQSLLSEPDFLILGVDDGWTRFAVTNQRVMVGKPYINLGFYGWEASYLLVKPKETACWACLWRPKDSGIVEKLKREGRCPQPEPNVPGAVIPATVQHLIGFAAGEVMKYFTGLGRLVQYYRFNVMTGESDIRFVDSPNFLKPDPECPVCMESEQVDISELSRE